MLSGLRGLWSAAVQHLARAALFRIKHKAARLHSGRSRNHKIYGQSHRLQGRPAAFRPIQRPQDIRTESSTTRPPGCFQADPETTRYTDRVIDYKAARLHSGRSRNHKIYGQGHRLQGRWVAFRPIRCCMRSAAWPRSQGASRSAGSRRSPPCKSGERRGVRKSDVREPSRRRKGAVTAT